MGTTSSFSTLGNDGKQLIHIDTDKLTANNTNKRPKARQTNTDNNNHHDDNDHFYLQEQPSMNGYDPEEIQRIMNQSIDAYDEDIIDIDTGNIILFIGKNSNGEAGLGHKKSLKILTKLPSWIEHIYSGNAYTIYSGNNNKILYASGSNYHGACGINNLKANVVKHTKIAYFNEHDINIHKICINPTGSCSFWVTNDNKIYGNGLNDKFQLGLSGKSNKSGTKFYALSIVIVITIIFVHIHQSQF